MLSLLLKSNAPPVPESVAMRFIKQYNITHWEDYNEKKQTPKGNFEDKLKQWHSSWRKKVNKMGNQNFLMIIYGEVFNETVNLV